MTVKTQPQLNAEIQTSFPDNIIGQITPSITRGMLQDLSDTLFASSSSLSAANIAAALNASSPSAPQINLFNSTDISTASFFGSAYTLEVISNRAGIIAQTINNFSNANFPPAMNATGWLRAGAEGGQVFGYFGRAVAEVAGGASHELDAFNNSSQNAPLTVPRGDGFGTGSTWTTGLCLASGSSTGKNNWAGLYIVREPTAPGTALFNYGIVFNSNAVLNTGIYMDATASASPATSILVRNSGQSTNVHLITQTMGSAVLANPFLQHLNASGIATAQVNQSGTYVSNGAGTFPTLTGIPCFYGITDQAAGSTMATASATLETYTNGTAAFGGSTIYRTARGSAASPANLVAADLIGVTGAMARWNGSFNFTTASLNFNYTDDGTHGGTEIEFRVTPNGSTAVGSRITAGKILNSGCFAIGGTVDLGAGGLSLAGTLSVGNSGNGGAGSIIANSFIWSKFGTAVPAGGVAGYLMSTTSTLGIYFGSGAPTVSAAQGSLYIRSDGSSTSTRLYVNTNGSTTWTNVVTAA